MYREYGELSTLFYELTKPIGHSIQGDIEYYSHKLEGLAGRVLEAGVGTGRMLIPLIKKGIRTDRVDSSPEMLAQCKINMKKHHVNAVLYEQNLMDLSLPEKYDAIIMPAGSFCLLPKNRVDKVLQNFHQQLNVGGRLIIDLEKPLPFQEGAVTRSRCPVSEGRDILLTRYSEKIDRLKQKTSYVNQYELIERGKVIKTEIANFSLYWYGLAEFETKLSLTRYRDITCESGYGTQASDMLTFTAYKSG